MIAVFRNGWRDPEDSLRIVKFITNEGEEGSQGKMFHSRPCVRLGKGVIRNFDSIESCIINPGPAKIDTAAPQSGIMQPFCPADTELLKAKSS